MSSLLRTARLAVLAAVAVTGCDDVDTFSGDPYPTRYVSRAGAVSVEVRAPGELPRPAVLDLLSPLTVLDYGPDTQPVRRLIELDLLGVGASGGTVSRARFIGTILQLHPCAGEQDCVVGDPALPYAVTAILGADLLAGDAIRFDFAAEQLFVLPDIAGDASARTALCDGVFQRPFQGGGTLVIEGSEVEFFGRRIVLEGCLAPDTQGATPPNKRGGDVLLVMSTGLGANILAESAYFRYADASLTPVPDFLTLPTVIVRIVSGPITGRLATVPTLALVGTSPRNPRGACREVYASQFLETAPPQVCVPGVECPCDTGDQQCGAPSVVRLAPTAGLNFVVVPDDDPLLQALRAELRPLVGEVDGLMGTDAVLPLELDVDYPHDRLLWRCAVDRPTTRYACQVRPQLGNMSGQAAFRACIAEGG